VSERAIKMKYTFSIMVAVLSLSIIGPAGCFSSHPRDIEMFYGPKDVNVTSDSYVLQPPDIIEIYSSNVLEIHLQRQRIRPDGKVSFEALGELEVAGKTLQEVEEMLKEKVAELYTLPGDHPIDVRIIAYLSKVYYVLGQVYSPGPKEYTGRDTLLTALAAAQPTPLAWEERIQVIRPSGDRSIRPKIFEVNFDRMIAHGDASKDVLLQEGDIIFVPPTVLAAAAMVLEELIRPIARAFSGVYIMYSDPTRGRREGGYGGGGGYYSGY
jgi:polysaccharide export outer membrane protein